MRLAALAVLSTVLSLSTSACSAPAPLGEKAEQLEKPKEKVAAEDVLAVTLKSEGTKLSFDMEAPIERIHGSVESSAVSATLDMDPRALSKTTGLVSLSLATLVLSQQRDDDNDGQFSEATVNDAQNQHARAWLEIDESVPQDIREKNQRVDFSLREVSGLSAENVYDLPGDERTVTFMAVGDFLLHQRKIEKSVPMQAVFKFEGDTLKSVKVSTREPFFVGLAQHDVHPRESFGVLAQKTLSTLSNKVAQVAEVSVELEFEASAVAAEAMAKRKADLDAQQAEIKARLSEAKPTDEVPIEALPIPDGGPEGSGTSRTALPTREH